MVGIVFFLQRQKLEFGNDEDVSDNDEEQPQIVVVRRGDLSAEEVEREKQLIESGSCFFSRISLFIIKRKEEGILHSRRERGCVVHRQKNVYIFIYMYLCLCTYVRLRTYICI